MNVESLGWSRKVGVVAVGAMMLMHVPTARADGFWSRTYEPKNHFRNLDAAADRFQKAEALAGDDPSKVGAYLRSGIVLSDVTCEAWLGTLGRVERNSNIYKDMLNIVGNLILGISGINGASPSSLARGSMGLAAANATVDAVKDEIVMGIIADIEAKIRDGRKVSAATIKQNIPTHIDDARGMLLAYHSDCSPNAVKNLLKTSLAAVKYAPADVTLGQAKDNANADLLIARLGDDLFGIDSNQALSEPTLYKLYVTQIVAPGSESEWIKGLGEDVKGFAPSFSGAEKDKRRAILSEIAALRGFGQRYIAQRDAEIAKKSVSAQQLIQTSQVSVKVAADKAAAVDADAWTGLPMRSKDTFSAQAGASVDLTKLEVASNDATAIAVARPDAKTRGFQEAAATALQQASAADAAKKELGRLLATPLPQISAEGIRAARSTVPVSINAVLVPVGR